MSGCLCEFQVQRDDRVGTQGWQAQSVLSLGQWRLAWHPEQDQNRC